MTLPKPGPGRPEHPSYHPHMRGMGLREFLGWLAVGLVVALLLLVLGVN